MPNFSDILEKRDLSLPVIYGISDRRAFPELASSEYLKLLFRTRAQVVQWREKDLEPEENRPFIQLGARLAADAGKIFLVNSLATLALEEGAGGVHLTSEQPVEAVHRIREQSEKKDFLIGKSAHSFAEAEAAESAGADYVLLGPVFPPLSKESNRAPLGRTTLLEVVQALSIPVIALGGLDESNIPGILNTGVAGVAGITWVHDELKRLIPASRDLSTQRHEDRKE